jgi:carbonic anhydrase
MNEHEEGDKKRHGVDAAGLPEVGLETAQTVHGEANSPPKETRIVSSNGQYTTSLPWEDVAADCLVITCSDHRFRKHVGELVEALGYKTPHVLSFPSGIAITHPLVSALGFLSKAIDKLVEKAISVTGAKEVVCIAHEDCGVYGADKIKLVDMAARHLRGKSIRDIQLDHVMRSTKRLQAALRRSSVRAFYADVEKNGSAQKVTFKPIV